ncbi:MAG: carboxylating nicotinate-nucleotide diphosphorylase [Candidatus Hydrothermarchaeales archaeon]
MLSKLLEFLEEDLGKGDITTDSILPDEKVITAKVIVKGNGVLAGIEECEELLDHFGITYETSFKDGDNIKKGDIILRIQGDARKILALERLMLNLMMRMSGIATTTNQIVRKCKPHGVMIAGTRKTTPGFRYFEKKAIKIGGGYPHRQGLYDEILIKDNHIAITALEKAVEKARNTGREKIEVEVSSLKDAIAAYNAGATTIMLDNMKPEKIEIAITELEKRGIRDKLKIELSGNITPENVGEYAKLKPDLISLGYLTTSAPWLDMGLKVG